MIIRLLLLFLFCIPARAIAQDSAAVQFHPDSSEVNVRTADSSTINRLANEEVFNYAEEAENPDTFLNLLMRWLSQVIQYLFNNTWASVLIRLVFIAIFGIVLIALINQLLGGNLTSSFSKKNPQKSLSLSIKESELSATDYEELLSSALSENRYRDAVRILYLKALKQLHENELIAWKADKTNHDYLQELGAHPSRNLFNKLTTYYEYVEYGDFEIGKTGFENVQDIYQQFTDHTRS